MTRSPISSHASRNVSLTGLWLVRTALNPARLDRLSVEEKALLGAPRNGADSEPHLLSANILLVQLRRLGRPEDGILDLPRPADIMLRAVFGHHNGPGYLHFAVKLGANVDGKRLDVGIVPLLEPHAAVDSAAHVPAAAGKRGIVGLHEEVVLPDLHLAVERNAEARVAVARALSGEFSVDVHLGEAEHPVERELEVLGEVGFGDVEGAAVFALASLVEAPLLARRRALCGHGLDRPVVRDAHAAPLPAFEAKLPCSVERRRLGRSRTGSGKRARKRHRAARCQRQQNILCIHSAVNYTEVSVRKQSPKSITLAPRRNPDGR